MERNPTNRFSEFSKFLDELKLPYPPNKEFLFEVYETVLYTIEEFATTHEQIEAKLVNKSAIVFYIVSEYYYYTAGKSEEEIKQMSENENFISLMISNIADKYLTNNHFDYQKGLGMSIYYPPISSLTLYLNFILGMLKRFPKYNPQTTLMRDVMAKAFSLAKSIVDLLTGGFETEAFSTWRTLHETECVLAILNKYDEDVYNSYLRHIKYGVAYRSGLSTKEKTDEIFVEIKQKMKDEKLKSKDMKRFIEYGWLFAIPEFNLKTHKLNFRDGLQKSAGLSEYHRFYEMSSEVAHSSPILIYSLPSYIGDITLLNLFETFFRIEAIFTSFFIERIGEEEERAYAIMRNIHYSQLREMYKNEKRRFLAKQQNRQ